MDTEEIKSFKLKNQNNLISKIYLKIKPVILKHHYLFLLFIFFIILSVVSSFQSKKDQILTTEVPSADTLIPKGYVLLPIELTNIQAIAGLIDGYGVVDVYSENQKVLNKVKILRAPLNPDSYAILIPDEVAREFLNFKGPFSAMVQSKTATADQHFVRKIHHQQKQVKIEYNGG